MITKNEAGKRRKDDATAEIAALEKIVDKAIMATDGRVYVDTGNARSVVVAAVADKYRGAGWNVETGSDQREGNWMTLI